MNRVYCHWIQVKHNSSLYEHNLYVERPQREDKEDPSGIIMPIAQCKRTKPTYFKEFAIIK